MGVGISMTSDEKADNHRLDKWLWQARFYKTRSLATTAINGGKVHLNAERVKPAHRVRIGDRVSLSLQGIVAEFEVLRLPERRGPAAEAQSCFLETPASAGRRAKLGALVYRLVIPVASQGPGDPGGPGT
jgi:ribosome-associated heat shock protein Hsp15